MTPSTTAAPTAPPKFPCIGKPKLDRRKRSDSSIKQEEGIKHYPLKENGMYISNWSVHTTLLFDKLDAFIPFRH